MDEIQDRLEGVINYVATKEGISSDKLRRYWRQLTEESLDRAFF